MASFFIIGEKRRAPACISDMRIGAGRRLLA